MSVPIVAGPYRRHQRRRLARSSKRQANGVAKRYDDAYTPVCIAGRAQKQAGACSTQGEHTFEVERRSRKASAAANAKLPPACTTRVQQCTKCVTCHAICLSAATYFKQVRTAPSRSKCHRTFIKAIYHRKCWSVSRSGLCWPRIDKAEVAHIFRMTRTTTVESKACRGINTATL